MLQTGNTRSLIACSHCRLVLMHVVLDWSGIDRRLKYWLYLNCCWGVSSGECLEPHTPFGPRKRAQFMRKSSINGHQVKEWPQIPQFGHLERLKTDFTLCHSSILERRCWRSSLAEIPNLAACSARNFFRWLPVSRRFFETPDSIFELMNPRVERHASANFTKELQASCTWRWEKEGWQGDEECHEKRQRILGFDHSWRRKMHAIARWHTATGSFFSCLVRKSCLVHLSEYFGSNNVIWSPRASFLGTKLLNTQISRLRPINK